MARRKRASLKDKGPEALGLTQKKGKGIDVLFGGSTEERTSDASIATDPDTEDVDQPAPVTASDQAVDELGLPVAMEAPPDDLEFATTGSESTGPERDAFDPSLSPFSPSGPVTASPAPADDDLSGLMEQDDLSGLEAETAEAAPPPVPDSSTVDEETVSSLPPVATMPAEETPSVEAGEEDLSGLDGDLPEPPAVTPPPAGTASVPPPTTDPFTSTPPFTPPPPAGGQTTTSPQPSVSPPPPPASPSPSPPPASGTTPRSPSMLPHSRIESLGGIVTEGVTSYGRDILPADVGERDVDNIIPVQEREQLETDAALAARVTRYIGRERRESLDEEIEALYHEVATELSVNKEDAAFALKTLSEAQDIIFEDAHQYDEALYRVAVVKTMLARKRNFQRWSYTWGLGVFFYGLVWMGTFIAGFLFTGTIAQLLNAATDITEGVRVVQGAWFSALSGGVGGIVNIFWGLYDHISRKQDFDRQYVMYYLVQPLLGFILGAAAYFIVQAGFLVINLPDEMQSTDVITAIAMLLGFVAGFRQRLVFQMIDRIVQKVMPDREEEVDGGPVSAVPVEDRRRLGPPVS